MSRAHGHSTASQRETQSRANLQHLTRGQVADAPPHTRLGHRDGVMQIDGAGPFHSVIDVQNDFGRHTANGRCDRRHGNRRQMANRTVTRKNQNRALLVRRRESKEADLAQPIARFTIPF